MSKIITFSLVLMATLSLSAQHINQSFTDDEGEQKLLGIVNEQGLKQAPYAEWFNNHYEDYLLNDRVIKKLKDSLSDYKIQVFFGTWCGDSKRELPRFYKILKEAKFPDAQLEVIAVDETEEAYKQAPNHEEKGLNIHRVPTFIFYKDGKEINRIVEFPKETLEKDMLNIVSGERYVPNYTVANYVYALIQSKPLDTLKQQESFWLSRLPEFVKGSRELNTLGYVLLRSNETEKALYVFDLNTKIFPNSYNVYDSLAEAYYNTANYSEALKTYYKVLSLKPDETHAVEMIEKIKTELEEMEKSKS